MQLVGEAGMPPLQLAPQHLGEEVVVAVVMAVVAERHDEELLAGDAGEELPGVVAPGDQRAQRAA